MGLELEARGSEDETGDPFVTLSVGSEQRRSKVAPKSLNPRWDEVFVFRGAYEGLTSMPLTV